jgi:hypothetical protein
MDKKTVLMISCLVIVINVALLMTHMMGSPIGTVSWASHYDNFQQMTDAADIIVVGFVHKGQGFLDGNPPIAFNDYTIDVLQVLKGSINNTQITVRQTAYVMSDPEFLVGENLVLFLHDCSYDGVPGIYYTIGGPEGRFFIIENRIFSVMEKYPTVQTSNNLNTFGQEKEQFIDILLSHTT